MDESVIKHLEQPQVGTLKLSEAIRIGAKLRPQGKDYYFVDGKTCAVGAAWEGSGRDPMYCSSIETMRVFGISEGILGDVICKNDDGWTREEIAAWLETQGY